MSSDRTWYYYGDRNEPLSMDEIRRGILLEIPGSFENHDNDKVVQPAWDFAELRFHDDAADSEGWPVLLRIDRRGSRTLPDLMLDESLETLKQGPPPIPGISVSDLSDLLVKTKWSLCIRTPPRNRYSSAAEHFIRSTCPEGVLLAEGIGWER